MRCAIATAPMTDQQTRAEAEEDAETASRHILAAVWGEIQALALEDAAVRMVLLTANGRLNNEDVPKLIKEKQLKQVLR